MAPTLESRVQFLGDVPNPKSPITGLWMQGAYNLLHEAMAALAEARADAERYRWIRHRTSAHGLGNGRTRFGFPTVEGGPEVLQGSVAQHLDAVLDAECHARRGGSDA